MQEEVKWAWVCDPNDIDELINWCSSEERVDEEVEAGIRQLDSWSADGQHYLGSVGPARRNSRVRYWKMNNKDGLLWSYVSYYTAFTKSGTPTFAIAPGEWREQQETRHKFNTKHGYIKSNIE